MRSTKALIQILILFPLIVFFGCDPAPTGEDTLSSAQSSEEQIVSKIPGSGLLATGEFYALWEGCEDGHEESPDHEEGGCSGNDGEDHHDDGHEEDGHDDVTHGGNRPAREFYLEFNAQLKNEARGMVNFAGLNEYEDVNFTGHVTWVEQGRSDHELFFGGEVTEGTVSRGCFLFSVQDNDEGKNAEADRLQYRLYGSANAPCHIPDHFPKGYPIVVYYGNLQVH